MPEFKDITSYEYFTVVFIVVGILLRDWPRLAFPVAVVMLLFIGFNFNGKSPVTLFPVTLFDPAPGAIPACLLLRAENYVCPKYLRGGTADWLKRQ